MVILLKLHHLAFLNFSLDSFHSLNKYIDYKIFYEVNYCLLISGKITVEFCSSSELIFSLYSLHIFVYFLFFFLYKV